MRGVSLIVLSRYQDLYNRFVTSIKGCTTPMEKILVQHKGHELSPEQDWNTLTIDAPFNFARYVNSAIKRATLDNDILLVNDDVIFTDNDTVEILRNTLEHDDRIGILSPRVIGGAQTVQTHPPNSPVTYTPHFLAFLCVLMRRDMVERIGPLDERFDGYGMEDVDYCVRARMATWYLAVNDTTSVVHGSDGMPNSTSFFRAHGTVFGSMGNAARQKYMTKWGGKGLEDIWGAKLSW
jgi:hypothetical protein